MRCRGFTLNLSFREKSALQNEWEIWNLDSWLSQIKTVSDTKYVSIKNYQNPFTLNSNIILDFKELEQVDSFLGVTINTSLNWEPLSQNWEKTRKVSGLLFCASKFLPLHAMILLYNALAYSKIIYWIEIWGNAPSTHFDKVFIIQQRLVCHIFKTPPNDHTAPLFH